MHFYETGSSVSVVYDYGLRPGESGSIPGRGNRFFLCVQTGSEAHPTSYPIGTEGPFPGGKELPGHDADHSPHLLPKSRMSRCCISSPQKPSWRAVGLLYFNLLHCSFTGYRVWTIRIPLYSFCISCSIPKLLRI
jgi:hypothetical protein